jgi:DNA recombination protein RmuC
MPAAGYLLLGFLTGVALGFLLGLLRQNRPQEQALLEVERRLAESFSRATTDMAGRVEKLKGDLRSELGSQIQSVAAMLGDRNDVRLEQLRTTVEGKLWDLQRNNTAQLEQIRQTVEEKLEGTLQRRLGESFKLVSERLELVHKGLGEMQSLAHGVGDLKRVLSNVKARGTWGEMQLGNLLDQVLTREQYACNVATRPGNLERVEFAIRLPGRDGDVNDPVWLPIDAKFPKEDYERLIAAADVADAGALELAASQLELRIRQEAKAIRDKYVEPPHTTDFAILYLPVEGLYAEVLRRPGLLEALQRDCRVTIAGPTVLCALLNSLQMGFRTLAIEQRSSEVWSVLSAVKNEFNKFGSVLGKVQKKLQEASSVIESAATRTKAIERKLRDVQQMPANASLRPPDREGLLLADLGEEKAGEGL